MIVKPVNSRWLFIFNQRHNLKVVSPILLVMAIVLVIVIRQPVVLSYGGHPGLIVGSGLTAAVIMALATPRARRLRMTQKIDGDVRSRWIPKVKKRGAPTALARNYGPVTLPGAQDHPLA